MSFKRSSHTGAGAFTGHKASLQGGPLEGHKAPEAALGATVAPPGATCSDRGALKGHKASVQEGPSSDGGGCARTQSFSTGSFLRGDWAPRARCSGI